MAAERRQNREEYKDESTVFQRNAFLLIDKMVEMASQTQEDTSYLVDEILHSIFFLGEITIPEFSPKQLFAGHTNIFNDLKEVFPEAFTLYFSHLPRRSPFSCVLDMVVHLKGQENEDEIRTTLQELTHTMMKDASKKILYSTTICISAGNSTDSVRQYGVSMSTTGRPAGQILVAASCLNFWDEYVADAVMSYYPNRKRYFDVTIQLPADVRYEAFNLRSREKINPCLSCEKMFGLFTTEKKQRWAYGNCAEVESLSNLLKEEEEVRDRVQRIGNWTEENKEKVRQAVIKHLRRELENVDFEWDNQFYTAQSARAENEGEEEAPPE